MGKGKKGSAMELQRDICALEEEEKEPCTSQFHVLAVDDSLIDRKVIERLLKISAYKVTTVESGRRALEFLGLDEDHKSVDIESLKVNMIITDYCMPGMTGYDLLKKIKESSALREIPVVVMSSENVLPRIDRCLKEGAEEFILKPVKLADVKRLKGHIVKGMSKLQPQQKQEKQEKQEHEQQQQQSRKRKHSSESNDNISEQPSEKRPRLEELTVA